ncbi:MAG: efflux RND transporter periplasmic adaptor subunit [Bacteroidota bacterium]
MLRPFVASLLRPASRLGVRWPILVALLGGGTLFLAACATEPPPPPEVIRPVRYTQVFAAGSSQQRTFAGTARSASEQRLSFRVGGTVERVLVEVGSRVQRGTLLAELDESDYALQREQAEAGLAQALAESRNAQANYERVVALYENSNASRSDLDAARAGFESASAAVRSGETARDLAAQNVRYTRLSAPVNGSVAQVAVEANETVSPGQVIVVVNSEGRPEVEVAIPESFIGRIRPGQGAEASFDAVGETALVATVTEVGTATTGGGTFPVTVRLNRDTDAVRPGMAAEVTFQIEGQAADASRVLVPPEAVEQDQQAMYLFVLQPQEGGLAVAERRTVTLGALTVEGLEVVEGVRDGEYVATAGLRTLQEGQQVRLLEND